MVGRILPEGGAADRASGRGREASEGTVAGRDLCVGRKAPTSRRGVGCGTSGAGGVASAPRCRFRDLRFRCDPLAFDGPVDRRSADTEKLGNFESAVLAAVHQ